MGFDEAFYDVAVAVAEVGVLEDAFVEHEVVEFFEVVAGDAGEDVVFEVVVDVVGGDGESFEPAGVGGAGVFAGVGVEEVGHGGVFGGVADA